MIAVVLVLLLSGALATLLAWPGSIEVVTGCFAWLIEAIDKPFDHFHKGAHRLGAPGTYNVQQRQHVREVLARA